jgi:thioester reductase-like protein
MRTGPRSGSAPSGSLVTRRPAISTLGERTVNGFETYHVMNPYDDGVGLDEYVDWLIDAGYPICRIDDYSAWLQRFDATLRALPEQQRQASLLPLLHNYQRPEKPTRGTIAPTDRFRAAVQEAKIGSDKDIPHVRRRSLSSTSPTYNGSDCCETKVLYNRTVIGSAAPVRGCLTSCSRSAALRR